MATRQEQPGGELAKPPFWTIQLLRKREITVPTWRGWLVLMVCFGSLLLLVLKTLDPFLAVSAPIRARMLVIEGWAPDYALHQAVEHFHKDHYERLYVTGGPIEAGAPLSEYKTYAELGGATLLKLGLTSNEVQVVPAPNVRQDRTFTSAEVLRECWKKHGIAPTNINLLTLGPHARRSRLLFEKALGPAWHVGVIAIPSESYDPQHWWRSSPGVRTVTGEAFAYIYSRLLFRTSRAEAEIKSAQSEEAPRH
jgi:hypothetical protein